MCDVPRLLYELLPELRRESKLTQEALARKASGPEQGTISLGTIQGYEKPARAGVVPEVEILDALADALGVDAAETFYEYPLAEARRLARPAASKRRTAKSVEPADVAAVVQDVAPHIAAQRDGDQSAPKPKRRKGRGT